MEANSILKILEQSGVVRWIDGCFDDLPTGRYALAAAFALPCLLAVGLAPPIRWIVIIAWGVIWSLILGWRLLAWSVRFDRKAHRRRKRREKQPPQA